MNQMYTANKHKVIVIFRYWDSIYFGMGGRYFIDYIKGDTLDQCMVAFDVISAAYDKTEVLEICRKTE